mgnify:CR=1 FL=1
MTDDTPKPAKKLTPANQNPWYILMTLHKEQPEGAEWWNYDEELHAKNRRDWNKWAARGLSEEKLAELRAMTDGEGKPHFEETELVPHDDKEFAALAAAFTKASAQRGATAALPPPDQGCGLSHVAFDRVFIARGLLFPGYADLSGATFSGDAFLSGVKFSRKHRVDFSHATFKGKTTFLNAEMEGAKSFAHAVFEKHPPSFHGAKLNEGAALHGVRWPDPPTPQTPPPEKDSAKARDAIATAEAEAKEAAQQHVYNYQRLKQIMEGLKKHEDELNFFAMEMAAQRVVDGKRSLRGLLNGIYGAVSDYGRSILRPTLAFFPFFALSAPVFEQSARVGEGCAPLTGAQAAGVSLATFLSVLPGLKDTINYKCLSTLATFTAGFNAVVGAALLFLIGLGLRNRFRMK